MKRAVRALLERAPFLRGLFEQVRRQGAFPAGHYYSPIPSEQEVRRYLASRRPPGDALPGIDLNARGQRAVLDDYVRFYPDLPFPEERSPASRYWYRNDWFSYSDAIFLYCFLRKNAPRRIIEVGSGFSSAAILDTVDGLQPPGPEITFVEPYPERLLGLFRKGDRERVRLIEKPIQEVPSDLLLALEPGDLLLVDSSHVVKCGSDLQLLLLEIVPRLRPGVFVHFHDVFYPFDYPSEWLEEGRYWNEGYFLRAFLTHNSEWSIYFFNSYAHRAFGDLIREKMPLCARNPGGSLYLRRAGGA